MSINLDKDTCIGCGTCSALCPNSFKMTDDGKAEVTSQEDTDCSQKASESCPVQAISIN